MADYPSPSSTNMGDPGSEKGFEAPKAPVMSDRQPKQVLDGSRWINSNGVGKLNENRSTTLRPMGKNTKK